VALNEKNKRPKKIGNRPFTKTPKFYVIAKMKIGYTLLLPMSNVSEDGGKL